MSSILYWPVHSRNESLFYLKNPVHSQKALDSHKCTIYAAKDIWETYMYVNVCK